MSCLSFSLFLFNSTLSQCCAILRTRSNTLFTSPFIPVYQAYCAMSVCSLVCALSSAPLLSPLTRLSLLPQGSHWQTSMSVLYCKQTSSAGQVSQKRRMLPPQLAVVLRHRHHCCPCMQLQQLSAAGRRQSAVRSSLRRSAPKRLVGRNEPTHAAAAAAAAADQRPAPTRHSRQMHSNRCRLLINSIQASEVPVRYQDCKHFPRTAVLCIKEYLDYQNISSSRHRDASLLIGAHLSEVAGAQQRCVRSRAGEVTSLVILHQLQAYSKSYIPISV